MSMRSKRDRAAVQPRFAPFAIAGLIVLAVIVTVLTTSADRYSGSPSPLLAIMFHPCITHEADACCDA